MDRPSRRRFLRGSLTLAGLGLLSGCRFVLPQGSRQEWAARIGFLSPTNGPASREFEACRQGLRELG